MAFTLRELFIKTHSSTMPPSLKKTQTRLKQSHPSFRPSLFWDVDIKTIDPQKHASYIIERIMDLGNDDEVRWLVRHYSLPLIKKTLKNSRGVLHKKTKALWTLVLQ